jgi:hypothetical protein
VVCEGDGLHRKKNNCKPEEEEEEEEEEDVDAAHNLPEHEVSLSLFQDIHNLLAG